jgi:enamine deaminase RidA (YjgF/YER057c/UK114 family)
MLPKNIPDQEIVDKFTEQKNTMKKSKFFVTPDYWEYLLNELHYSQAVKIGDRVETSGQGGWDDNLQIPESCTQCTEKLA